MFPSITPKLTQRLSTHFSLIDGISPGTRDAVIAPTAPTSVFRDQRPMQHARRVDRPFPQSRGNLQLWRRLRTPSTYATHSARATSQQYARCSQECVPTKPGPAAGNCPTIEPCRSLCTRRPLGKRHNIPPRYAVSGKKLGMSALGRIAWQSPVVRRVRYGDPLSQPHAAADSMFANEPPCVGLAEWADFSSSLP